jgi:hypothetical protein
MLKFVKDFQEAGKLAYSTIDVPFEREAYMYQNKPDKAPLLNWLEKHNVINIIYRGSWVLDKDIQEHYKNYRIEPHSRSPIIFYAKQYNSGEYPYEYYQDYLKRGNFWSGVGYDTGILRGNHKTLIELGYKGVLVYYNDDNVAAWEAVNA